MNTVQKSGTVQRVEVASYEKLMRQLKETQPSVPSSLSSKPQQELNIQEDESKFDLKSLSDEAKEKLEAEMQKLNQSIASSGKLLKFKYSEEAETTYVEVIDAASQEVVVSLPPQFLIDLTVKMKEIIGMFIDERY